MMPPRHQVAPLIRTRYNGIFSARVRANSVATASSSLSDPSSRRCQRNTGMSSFRVISDSAVNASNTTAMKNAKLPWGRSRSITRCSGGSPKRRKPSTNSAPAMSGCMMASMKTGQRVRMTQWTNALLRLIRLVTALP